MGHSRGPKLPLWSRVEFSLKRGVTWTVLRRVLWELTGELLAILSGYYAVNLGCLSARSMVRLDTPKVEASVL